MKNNKGFLLAETIVTVCVIATLATSMYIYISRTANRFEERNNYEKVVDVYKLNTIKTYLDKNIKEASYLSTSSIIRNLASDTTKIPSTLKTNLKLENLFIISASKDSMSGFKTYLNSGSVYTKSLKDYLNSIEVNDDGIDVDHDYRMIGMFKEDSNSTPTFANIVVSVK